MTLSETALGGPQLLRPEPALAMNRSLSLNPQVDHALAQMWRGKAPANVTNHFRGLRRELLVMLDQTIAHGTAPVILVTSALPDDGKTFVAASLARTFANAPDCQVTLLDFDIMRRTTSGLFNAQRLPGISDCLASRTDIRRVLCKTDIERLSFVPAGSIGEDNREAFVSGRVDSLFAHLRASGADMIHVLDAPPVIPIVETAVLASKADMVVIVVRSGVTPRAAVEDAVSRLGADARVCIVLNAVAQPSIGRDYDYAYKAYGSTHESK